MNPTQSSGQSDGRWWLHGPVDEYLIPKTLGMNTISEVHDTLMRVARALGYECETAADFDVVAVIADMAEMRLREHESMLSCDDAAIERAVVNVAGIKYEPSSGDYVTARVIVSVVIDALRGAGR